METVNIGGLKISNVSMDFCVRYCLKALEEKQKTTVYTPNAEMSKAAFDDSAFMEILNSATLLIPDGQGVVLASKILRTPLKEKVAGCKLAINLLSHIEKGGYKLFLLGGKPNVASVAKNNILSDYPTLNICGVKDGYFKDDFEAVKEIKDSGAEIVFVCLGFPKQEKFIYNHMDECGATLMLGLGGTLDVLAGTAKHAPEIFVKLGLEWLYRGVLDPKRYKRLLKIPLFLIDVLKIRRRK